MQYFPANHSRARYAVTIRLSWGRAPALAILVLIVSLFTFNCSGERAADLRLAERRAVVISVDGLPPDLYLHPEKYGLRLPHLMRLKAEGSYAEAVEGVYPSVTYPSHTTLVTGRWPREHGIFSNRSSRQAGVRPQDWYWYAEAIRVPTLWDVARKKGLQTAAVSWPVTVGADIDWVIPEFRDVSPSPLSPWEATAAKSHPRGLLEEAFAAIGARRGDEAGDQMRTRVAQYILKTHRPHLLLVHLIELDASHHRGGPYNPAALETIRHIDALIGQLRATVDAIGLGDQTAFFIVSDHGFLPITRTLRPNVLLAKAGLLAVDRQGEITGGKIATVANGGSFFIYWPSANSDAIRKQADQALRPMREQGVLWAIFSENATAHLRADSDARLILEAVEGYSFGGKATGSWLEERDGVGGAHGYLPTRAGMAASFIAAGPGLRQAGNLGRIRMIEVAPTVARYLRISEPGLGNSAGLIGLFAPTAQN